MDSIITCFQLNRTRPKDKLFEDFFRSKPCRAILEDAFWWIWLYVFSPEHDAEKLDHLLLRMAKVFVGTYSSLPREHCDAIMKRFRDGLAQLLFLCFCIAFPTETAYFDDAFRHRIIRLVATWFVGYEPTRISCQHWEIESLLAELTDLERYPPAFRARIKKIIVERRQQKQKERAARNLKGTNKKKKKKKKSTRGLPNLLSTGGLGMHFVRHKREKTHTSIMKTQRTRRHHSMRNSMLLMRYLSTNSQPSPDPAAAGSGRALHGLAASSYQRVHSAPPRSYDCRVFLTNEVQAGQGGAGSGNGGGGGGYELEAGDQLERVLSQAPRTVEQWRKETYGSLVKQYKTRAKQLLRTYKKAVKKEIKSMDVNRSECETETKLLLSRKNEILAGDVHEYSNFLVVRHRTRRLKKMTKKKPSE